MTLQEIIEFLSEVDKKLNSDFPLESRERIFARSLKVQEELGELANEILIRQKLARKDKIESSSSDDLEKEWSDVFFSLLLLGINLDVDVPQAISNRINVIKQRHDIR